MNRNCRRKTEKVYVKVNSDFDATGYMQPRQITWGDGRTYPIEQVRDFRPANTIADMPGDCYTVMVKGQERHLFFERSDPRFPSRFGRWFVEVETNQHPLYGYYAAQYYSNNVPATAMYIDKKNGDARWTGISFPLIER